MNKVSKTFKEQEPYWHRKLEKQLGRMLTESEWQKARIQIYEMFKADLEAGGFDNV